jgi:hypothetical protein
MGVRRTQCVTIDIDVIWSDIVTVRKFSLCYKENTVHYYYKDQSVNTFGTHNCSLQLKEATDQFLPHYLKYMTDGQDMPICWCKECLETKDCEMLMIKGWGIDWGELWCECGLGAEKLNEICEDTLQEHFRRQFMMNVMLGSQPWIANLWIQRNFCIFYSLICSLG